MFEDGYNDTLRAQLNANVTRFAAYKAYHATQQIKQAKTDGSEPEPVLHKYNRWQATEYATTVARCRTARQFADFNSRADLFPCLRWLPSRSASPREEHRMFWNRVWRKDDPFWQTNQPGNLWNCKCDWEETDDEPTDGNPANTIAAQGLEGNPAITGEVFSPNASYFDVSDEQIKTINSFGRDMYKKNKPEKCTVTTHEGDIIDVPTDFYKESAKTSITDEGFWLKNEVSQNLGDFMPIAERLPNEPVDLGHNIQGGDAYRLKRKFRHFRVYLIKAGNCDLVLKVGEFSNNGNLRAYALSVKKNDR